jgi:hypothetical protein
MAAPLAPRPRVADGPRRCGPPRIVLPPAAIGSRLADDPLEIQQTVICITP